MATLTVVNNTGSDVVIGDVGVLVPGSGSDTYQDPVTIRDLALSRDLRSLVDAGTLSLTDGTNPITVEDLLEYFESGGFQFPFAPAVSSNARFWLIQQDAGLTSLSQVGFSTAPTVNGTPSVQNLQTAQFAGYAGAVLLGARGVVEGMGYYRKSKVERAVLRRRGMIGSRSPKGAPGKP